MGRFPPSSSVPASLRLPCARHKGGSLSPGRLQGTCNLQLQSPNLQSAVGLHGGGAPRPMQASSTLLCAAENQVREALFAGAVDPSPQVGLPALGLTSHMR